MGVFRKKGAREVGSQKAPPFCGPEPTFVFPLQHPCKKTVPIFPVQLQLGLSDFAHRFFFILSGVLS